MGMFMMKKKPAARLRKRPATSTIKRPAASTNGLLKRPATSRYNGRILVFKGRLSKEWCCRLLESRETGRGAPTPPETFEELRGPVQEVMGKTTFGVVDGAVNFKKAVLGANAIMLEGVKHNGDVFTPIFSIPKKKFSADAITFLSKQTKQPQPFVRELKTCFRLVAGDNSAESVH